MCLLSFVVCIHAPQMFISAHVNCILYYEIQIVGSLKILLLPGYLVRCVNDIKSLLSWVMLRKEAADGNIIDNKRLLVSLMEPTIEFIMKCIFKDVSQVCYGVFMQQLILVLNNM